ncbi:hypothetical protein R3X25_02350 [Lutibacter sp. TH_r2]|uniref:hypothetical protein n=1 Tax=Lutibacter sp. TH_r2 TaxID=3082083 RepID=UPI002954677B|nr:hypothetical protein [Lutibacter sp. TH_r2]MDV7186110.1 hypothetical protein [Lutibacter sp. TH_r2]
MSENSININEVLDELFETFYHRFIFYIPSEILTQSVLDKLDGAYNEWFDTLFFLDNELGKGEFDNGEDDALEVGTYVGSKQEFLEKNTFKLVKVCKSLSEFEIHILIEKYYEFLMLFHHISEWMSVNAEKYNKHLHINIIGAFATQLGYFNSHLKDICNYFGAFIDFEKEFDYSLSSFMFKYLMDVARRFDKIRNRQIQSGEDLKKEGAECEKLQGSNQVKIEEKSNQENQNLKPIVKKKKQKLQIDTEEVETIILTKIFNVNQEVLQQFKNQNNLKN